MSQNKLEHKFYGFFTSPSFWSKKALDLNSTDTYLNWANLMSEAVFWHETPLYTLSICRDGLILFERKSQSSLKEKTILNHVLAVQILLNSCLNKFHHEQNIQIRDVAAEQLINHDYLGQSFQNYQRTKNELDMYVYNARFLSSFVPVNFNQIDLTNQTFWLELVKHSVQNDPRLKTRANFILQQQHFDFLVQELDKVILDYDSVTTLADLSRAINLLGSANFESCLVLIWFILETYIFRYYNLRAKSFTREKTEEEISVSEALRELKKKHIMSYPTVQKIHHLRKLRNEVAHNYKFAQISAEDIDVALEVIRELMRNDLGIDLKLSISSF